MKQATTKLLVIVGAVAALGLIVLVTAIGNGGSAAPKAGLGNFVAGSTRTLRTVLVSTGSEPAPSHPGSRLNVLRLSGPVPSRPSAATVLTDEDCAADAQGVSHCVNRIRLAEGQTLTVRHPHRMMEVPCLSPGEHITVRAA
jgi:hypothetical protein